MSQETSLIPTAMTAEFLGQQGVGEGKGALEPWLHSLNMH